MPILILLFVNRVNISMFEGDHFRTFSLNLVISITAFGSRLLCLKIDLCSQTLDVYLFFSNKSTELQKMTYSLHSKSKVESTLVSKVKRNTNMKQTIA